VNRLIEGFIGDLSAPTGWPRRIRASPAPRPGLLSRRDQPRTGPGPRGRLALRGHTTQRL